MCVLYVCMHALHGRMYVCVYMHAFSYSPIHFPDLAGTRRLWSGCGGPLWSKSSELWRTSDPTALTRTYTPISICAQPRPDPDPDPDPDHFLVLGPGSDSDRDLTLLISVSLTLTPQTLAPTPNPNLIPNRPRPQHQSLTPSPVPDPGHNTDPNTDTDPDSDLGPCPVPSLGPQTACAEARGEPCQVSDEALLIPD